MSPKPPLICGTLLVAMIAAGFGHFLSVNEFTSRFPISPATRLLPAEKNLPDSLQELSGSPLAIVSAPVETSARKEFFEELLSEVRALRNENKNLIDQVAETNRDMMKMEFRLDTHSESFRPLPTSQERDQRSSLENEFDELPGVLPPRALPVLPTEE